MEDLDLESSLDESVTVVEWGTGLVEELAGDRLEVVITRPEGVADGRDDLDGDAPREIAITGFGSRWDAVDLTVLADAPADVAPTS